MTPEEKKNSSGWLICLSDLSALLLPPQTDSAREGRNNHRNTRNTSAGWRWSESAGDGCHQRLACIDDASVCFSFFLLSAREQRCQTPIHRTARCHMTTHTQGTRQQHDKPGRLRTAHSVRCSDRYERRRSGGDRSRPNVSGRPGAARSDTQSAHRCRHTINTLTHTSLCTHHCHLPPQSISTDP